MRPTPATDQHAAGSPPVPRRAALPETPVRVRPDGGRARPPAEPFHQPPREPVAAAGARVVDRDVRAAVERVLDDVLTDRVTRARAVDPVFAGDLAERVADFTRRGGKRIRSRLLWWALRACGGDEPAAAAALRVAAALEVLQTCALVQDDMMDGSLRRRGRPALHADVGAQYARAARPGRVQRFGEAAAVLAGDLALAWADDLVAETALTADTARGVRRLWSDMRTEMVAGQYLDLHGQITGSRSVPRALRAACLKSALYSVERPLALGAALAGADDATTAGLCWAGRRFGLAFQLRDDLTDVFAETGRTGRSAGGDVREGKPTYLVAAARAGAEATGDRAALAVLDRSLGDGGLTPAGLEEVREVLVRTGARATVEARIDRLVAQALHRFDDLRLDPAAGGRLRELLLSAAGATADRPAAHRAGPGPDPAVPLMAPATEEISA
ncbi:polyprenyl synthetase family protein [Streptomyces sp. TG1A-8]|uniref:polyprenyl synthetase family protein n=1 Tax=Streptomyces sp. TG1A-8 TaxID=3051385 RepID=UPI00265C8717|nr:polyprenyl synthetase family protein [Streptomyces sp. TG1A-8]MDO0929056.1 polyprenyl synthetase family protein [Streptomyces sp. TG1A-8]